MGEGGFKSLRRRVRRDPLKEVFERFPEFSLVERKPWGDSFTKGLLAYFSGPGGLKLQYRSYYSAPSNEFPPHEHASVKLGGEDGDWETIWEAESQRPTIEELGRLFTALLVVLSEA